MKLSQHPTINLSLDNISRYFPGLLLACTIWILSRVISQYIPNIGAVTIAIVLGILVGNVLTLPAIFAHGIKASEKKLLPLAIVFLGVQLQLGTLLGLGLPAIVVIVTTITTAVGVSYLIAPLFGFSRPFATLMGAGNGICGSSAIAAVGSAIDANEEDIGISIGIVNLLGTLGIFAVPAIAGWLGFNEANGGVLAGGTLQAVGQVVAAGFTIGAGAGSIALVIKMGRILMLAPMVVLFKRLVPQEQGQNKSQQVQIPRFIIGFFVMSIIASLHLIPQPTLAITQDIGKALLIIAMAGVGLRIRLDTLARNGLQALLFGSTIALAQLAMVSLMVFLLF